MTNLQPKITSNRTSRFTGIQKFASIEISFEVDSTQGYFSAIQKILLMGKNGKIHSPITHTSYCFQEVRNYTENGTYFTRCINAVVHSEITMQVKLYRNLDKIVFVTDKDSCIEIKDFTAI